MLPDYITTLIFFKVIIAFHIVNRLFLLLKKASLTNHVCALDSVHFQPGVTRRIASYFGSALNRKLVFLPVRVNDSCFSW